MVDATSTNGTDDRLAARAVELVASLTALVTGSALPPERAVRLAWTHAGDEDPAAAAVLWADPMDNRPQGTALGGGAGPSPGWHPCCESSGHDGAAPPPTR